MKGAIFVHACTHHPANSWILNFINVFPFLWLLRWLWWDLDDPSRVDACASYEWKWGADALHPRRSQFRPSDGHGDRSLRVTHGQRQPAHLSIDSTQPSLKYDFTAILHNKTEKSEEIWLPKWYRTTLQRVYDTLVWWIANNCSHQEQRQNPGSYRGW